MKSRAIQIKELDEFVKNEMYALLSQNFDGVEWDVFISDLLNKNWVILIEDNSANLIGFSTIDCYSTIFQNEKIDVIFSGDTIMARGAWNTFSLFRTWIKTVKTISSSLSGDRLFWLLIVSGFRTYRFLPVFWETFSPNYRKVTSTWEANLMKHLAQQRFGSDFDECKGIVRFPKPHRLNEDLSEIPDGRLLDPHVAHFIKLNPDYKNGDELVCLAELNDENLTPAGIRMLQQKTQFVG